MLNPQLNSGFQLPAFSAVSSEFSGLGSINLSINLALFSLQCILTSSPTESPRAEIFPAPSLGFLSDRVCMSNLPSAPCPMLYVDDNPADQFHFYQATLRTNTPLVILAFYSVKPALDYLKRVDSLDNLARDPRPRFLLSDFNIGSALGSHFIASVRALPVFARLPIIVFSASESEADVANSYAAGANYFLRKPSALFRLNAIVAALYDCATSPRKEFQPLSSLPEFQPLRITITHLDPPSALDPQSPTSRFRLE